MKTKLLLIFLGILLVGTFVSAEASYCCERTTDGAWCQNAPIGNCDDSFRKVPASCEATSYCKLGVCIDSIEGTCMENTPQKVCGDNEGVWKEGDREDIEQCSLGCCLVGDQAAFVTQTRCKRLSSLYGLETNFRTDIKNELTCIISATSDTKGACVFEKELEKTCSFITQKKCAEIENAEFHKDYLCSAESLVTNCGPSKKTTCVDGKDEIYFTDTCGNIANVYDSAKVDDKEYWAKIKDVSESCGYGSSNANSASCGNCDYFLGSTCKNYKSGADKRPMYGDNICKDLSCEYQGNKYEHGETWCNSQKGFEDNLPGSRYFRMVCYNGEVSVEPCADFRQEVCISSDIDGFSTAACRVNQWQDCVSQSDERDCENGDRRDCQWINDRCVPKFAPGFDFWNSEGDAETICSTGSAECTITYEKGLGGGKKCISGCECIAESWKDNLKEICVSLGDCGSSTNYILIPGYHDQKADYSGSGGDYGGGDTSQGAFDGGGGGGGGECFTKGTKILMADGNTKSIEEINIGDLVQGEKGTNKVLSLYQFRLGNQPLYSINEEDYFVTKPHPFKTTEGWKAIDPEAAKKWNPDLEISKLQIGDILITQNREVVVESIQAGSSDYKTKIYNFAVDGDKTYYANGYLVHNKAS